MKINHCLIAVLALLLCSSFVVAQNFKLSQTKIFPPQNKKVLLLRQATGQKQIILFQTRLRVNTDGSPLSYHPDDLLGRSKALNNICNAVAVRKGTSKCNLCIKDDVPGEQCVARFAEAVQVFAKFRDSGYQTVPAGFSITWQNVLAPRKDGNKVIPCVFKSGPFEGYFGSLTGLRNDLSGDKGECEINDQINPLEVPALVLVGGRRNVVKDFGAKVGDLLVAFNPRTKLFTTAIVGDSGPPDNLGEGSIRLNMNLAGKTVPPTNKAETFKLSIEDTQVLIAIIPGSKGFQPAKPFTADNINQRVVEWQKQSGFTTPESFIEFIKSFQPNLK
jgi:hypothetical protein